VKWLWKRDRFSVADAIQTMT